MTVHAIRKKLVDYLLTANDKKVKAIYTMVEDDINSMHATNETDLWGMLEERKKSFENGTAKMYSWEETKQAAIDGTKSKNLR
jgi:hypothetical protein